MYKLFYYTTKLQKISDITKQFDTFSCNYLEAPIIICIFANDSKGMQSSTSMVRPRKSAKY